jgi:hypothetical protein
MFNANKVLQIIAYLAELNGGRIGFAKLMLEMYLIDRESIAEREVSVSGDTYYSLDCAPVLGFTKNLLDGLENKDNPFGEYLVSEKFGKYSIILNKPPGCGDLSEKDMEYARIVFNRFKDCTQAQIKEHIQNLPECSKSNGAFQKIQIEDIMIALGRSQEEIASAKQEYEQVLNLYKNLGV